MIVDEDVKIIPLIFNIVKVTIYHLLLDIVNVNTNLLIFNILKVNINSINASQLIKHRNDHYALVVSVVFSVGSQYIFLVMILSTVIMISTYI